MVISVLLRFRSRSSIRASFTSAEAPAAVARQELPRFIIFIYYCLMLEANIVAPILQMSPRILENTTLGDIISVYV